MGLPSNEAHNITVDTIRSSLLSNEKYPDLVVVLKLGERGSAVVTRDLHIEVAAVTQIRKEIAG